MSNNKSAAAVAARIAPVVKRAAPVSGFESAPVSAPVAAPVQSVLSQDDVMRMFAEAQAQIAVLQAQLKEKSVKKERPLSFKVSKKGAVSVYGLSRFPTTLYANQWEKVFAQIDAMRAFFRDNDGKTVTGVDSQTGEAWSVVFHANRDGSEE
jgi:hypothetical protein